MNLRQIELSISFLVQDQGTTCSGLAGRRRKEVVKVALPESLRLTSLNVTHPVLFWMMFSGIAHKWFVDAIIISALVFDLSSPDDISFAYVVVCVVIYIYIYIYICIFALGARMPM